MSEKPKAGWMESHWREKVLEILRRLFEIMGGPPGDLQELVAAIGIVQMRFDAVGFSGVQASQKSTVLDDLAALQAGIDSPYNNLSPGANDSLCTLEAEMEIAAQAIP